MRKSRRRRGDRTRSGVIRADAPPPEYRQWRESRAGLDDSETSPLPMSPSKPTKARWVVEILQKSTWIHEAWASTEGEALRKGRQVGAFGHHWRHRQVFCTWGIRRVA